MSVKVRLIEAFEIPSTEIQFNTMLEVLPEVFEQDSNKTELNIDLRDFILNRLNY